MIDLGANPYIRNANGKTNYDDYVLSNLNNLPSVKSIFYPIKIRNYAEESEIIVIYYFFVDHIHTDLLDFFP